MMKKRLLLFLTLITLAGYVQQAAAQNQAANLQKYWTYRDRLREKFVVVDEHVERRGVNIPASYIDHGNNTLNWGDANNGMSHYLSLLATELWLLKANGQDYKETLKELYYAMLAMERLDLYSEYSLRAKHNLGMPSPGGPMFGNIPYVNRFGDVNGFHIRDDVSEEFWETYKSHFTVTDFTSVYQKKPNEKEERTMQEISQDNIFHNLEGLALVANLVGTESVADIPVTWSDLATVDLVITENGVKNGNTINFKRWAQDYVKRYIRFMQSTYADYDVRVGLKVGTLRNHWILVNPITNKFVYEGSGEDFDLGLFYNVGALAAGQAITGENLRSHDAFILSNSASSSLYNTLFNIGPFDAIEIPWPSPFSEVLKPIKIKVSFDDYKVRTLGAIGNIKNAGTFATLRSSRDNSTPLDYEHMPLMYTILHDPDNALFYPNSAVYNADRTMLENLLNAAPASGPTGNGNRLWSSESRLVWPERVGQKAGQNVEFSGMDYMTLHNLYYIALRREDLRGLIIPEGSDQYASGEARGKTVTASNTINGTTAQYIAREVVYLKPGFRAARGSTFTGAIGKREGQYDGQLYIDPTPTNGRIATKDYPDVGKATYAAVQYTTPITAIPLTIHFTEKSETVAPGQIAVYPNPATDRVNIELGENDGTEGTLTLMDSNGTVMRTQTFSGLTTSVDVNGLPAGIYLVRVTTNSRTFTEKISVLP